MAPATRRSVAVPIIQGNTDDSEVEESSSSSEEEDVDEEEGDDEEEEEEGNEAEEVNEVEKIEEDTRRKGKAPMITISLKKVCKVCKKSGHEAGFKGATYIDCPMKPCFLCKMPGHTTMTCPHRIATEHGVVPAPHRRMHNSLEYVFQRQLRPNTSRVKFEYIVPNKVKYGVLKYHSRRVTCLEFHPTNNNILLSGDKKGQLGVWDYGKVNDKTNGAFEKTVYRNIHNCLLNNMRFNPLNDASVYGVSSDGTVSCTDLETGMSESLVNLNPDGWQGKNSWRMLYGMDINSEKHILLVADNFGFLYMVDARSHNISGNPILIHKKGSKVVGMHCNPAQPDLFLSCGNDHFARLWDVRRLEAGSSLHNLAHKRVVNSAYFSPQSGNKILTTSQDNRIRVWDSIFGNLDSPSREIVHSHDFNRHLTPFRAEWDPKDPFESLAVIGRYISENINGIALHPIDFIDTSTGQLVAEVMDPNITTISPVNKLHPRDDVLASGSSRSLFIWKPKEKDDLVEQKEENRIIINFRMNEKKRKGKSGDKSDDDYDSDDDTSKGKKSSGKKSKPLNNGRSACVKDDKKRKTKLGDNSDDDFCSEDETHYSKVKLASSKKSSFKGKR